MQCLLVDDHPLVRGGMLLALRHLDPKVEAFEAESLAAAFAVLESHPRIALVLLDLNLGATAGIETLRAFRAWCDERDLSPRIVVVSAHGDPDLVREVIDHYGTGFILKTTSEAITRHALAITLEGGVYIPDLLCHALTHDRGTTRATTRRRDDPGPPILTDRETQVAALLIQGMSYKKIALELEKQDKKPLSEHTVRTHVSNIAWKLDVQTTAKFGVMAEIARRGLKFPHKP